MKDVLNDYPNSARKTLRCVTAAYAIGASNKTTSANLDANRLQNGCEVKLTQRKKHWFATACWFAVFAVFVLNVGCHPQPSFRWHALDNIIAQPAPRTTKMSLHHGVFWVYGLTGSDQQAVWLLVGMDPKTGQAKTALPQHRVDDIYQTPQGQMWVLSSINQTTYVLDHQGNSFIPMVQFPTPPPYLQALTDWRTRPFVLATHSIHYLNEFNQPKQVQLTEAVEPGRVIGMALAVTNHGIAYAGANSGEWGGQLYRIVVATGEVALLQKRDGVGRCTSSAKHLCGGVTSIIVDPDNQDCVLVGYGLIHYQESGRLVRVCDEHSEVVYPRGILPVGTVPNSCNSHNGPSPAQCNNTGSGSGVFSLQRTKYGYWMATGNAVYFVQKNVATKVEPIAKSVRDRVAMRWLPGALEIFTATARGASMGGNLPLLAPTNPDYPSSQEDEITSQALTSMFR